jgi:inner membrane protein
MDTLTHALSGALLARALVARGAPGADSSAVPAWMARLGPAPRPWQAVVVGLVAGAFPDIDSITESLGAFVYLQHHRGLTHSLVLAPLWGLLLAWLLGRCFAQTRRPGAWWGLLPFALGGVLIHIAGDWITQFGTMLLMPLSDERFGLGALFIIDLTFSGLLVAGLALSIVLPRARWPAGAALVAASAWVGVAWVGRQEALDAGAQFARAQGVSAQRIEAMPRPVSPFNWTVAVDDGERYHVAHLNTRRQAPLQAQPGDSFLRRFSAPYQPVDQVTWTVVPRFGDAQTPPWVRDAWAHPELAVYRWFAAAPALAHVATPAGEGGSTERCAVFRDLRFEFPGRGEPPFRYGVCLREDGSGRAVTWRDGRVEPI